jgi:Holliday junction resolvase RusA-like endonuclease
MIQFEVLGTPMPQGSKKAFAAHGRAMMKEAGGLNHAAWRNAVAKAAKDVAGHDGVTAPLTGPLRVDITYRFPMPKSRPKAVRQAGIGWKTTVPDKDKLDRCIGDALQAGGLIADDSLICDGGSTKYETTGWTGCIISITPMNQKETP